MAARSPGLTSEEFSERWKAHAGTAGATPIPERARGLAYAQNHPLLPQPSSEGGQGFGYRICAYDAVNEVWFDDPERLRERVRWLAENLPDEGEDRLFGARHSIAVEETVLLG
jgi:hypothetical protein